jgi:hypothetical protein
MQILGVKVENFLSQSFGISSFILDSRDLSTLIGIQDQNCQNIFKAITFAADVLLRKYKDNRSVVKSHIPTSSPECLRISISIAFDTNELGIISDFIISSDIPLMQSMNEPSIRDLKIQALRKCARKQIFTLFANPVLDIVARNPDFYQNHFDENGENDFLDITLRIQRGKDDFFIFQYPQGYDTLVIKGRDSVPKNFERIRLGDLIFDYLNNLDTSGKMLDGCQSLVIFNMLDKYEDSHKYLSIGTVPLPGYAGRLFTEIPELEPVSTYFVRNDIPFTFNNATFLDLIRAIYKDFMTRVNLRLQLEFNWSKLVLERVDPNLQLLEAWLRGRGKTASDDFERSLTLLLNLCGYRAMQVGSRYEDATQERRRTTYGKSKVGVDVVAFSPDNKEVLLCQCCTEWKDAKPSDVLTLNQELSSQMLAQVDSPELHFAVVTCDSKERLPPNMSIPNGVRIIDIADLLALLEEVKKGILPYYLVRMMF